MVKDKKTKKRIKDEKKAETTSDKMVKMVSGNLIAGVIISMLTISLVILILTLEFSLSKFTDPIKPGNLIQAIFVLAPHPLYGFMTPGFSSVIIALVGGAYIGGLVVRGAKKGFIVGISCFGLLMFFQIAIGFFFDFSTYQGWLAQINSGDGNIIIDFLLSAGLLVVAGAVGGIITRE